MPIMRGRRTQHGTYQNGRVRDSGQRHNGQHGFCADRAGNCRPQSPPRQQSQHRSASTAVIRLPTWSISPPDSTPPASSMNPSRFRRHRGQRTEHGVGALLAAPCGIEGFRKQNPYPRLRKRVASPPPRHTNTPCSKSRLSKGQWRRLRECRCCRHRGIVLNYRAAFVPNGSTQCAIS